MEVKLSNKNEVAFSSLKFGDIFTYGAVYYMKIYSRDDNINAVNLNGTSTTVFGDNVLVSPVEGYFEVVR